MKKQMLVTLALALLALPGLASAQLHNTLKADVPFAFNAGGVTMPAGACMVQSTGNGQALLLISSGTRSVYVLPNAAESSSVASETALVFHKYGDVYFLAGIKQEGNNRGFDIPRTRAEKEILAKNVSESDVEVLLASK